MSQILKTKEAFKEATPKQKILDLAEVEEVFEDMMLAKMPEIEISHDCTAYENPYFKTLNFTTYAGCFIIHPLNPDLALHQCIDAISDFDDTYAFNRYKAYFVNKVNNDNANKYTQVCVDPEKYVEELIVPPGTDKLKKNYISMPKLAELRDTSSSLGIKPHPLTKESDWLEQKQFFNDEERHINYHMNDDLYLLLRKADTIHTSHLSESAIYAAVLHKNIGSIDNYFKINRSSFYHINSLIIGKQKEEAHINVLKAFSNYKSGIIQPLVDNNWLDKLEKYLDYIRKVRLSYKGLYV